MNKDTIIHKISAGIHNKDPKADAFLFGSRARGDFRENSDWDILILVDDNKITHEIEDKFRDVLFDIELDTGQIISTFIYPKGYWNNSMVYSPLYESVKDEGVKL